MGYTFKASGMQVFKKDLDLQCSGQHLALVPGRAGWIFEVAKRDHATQPHNTDGGKGKSGNSLHIASLCITSLHINSFRMGSLSGKDFYQHGCCYPQCLIAVSSKLFSTCKVHPLCLQFSSPSCHRGTERVGWVSKQSMVWSVSIRPFHKPGGSHNSF